MALSAIIFFIKTADANYNLHDFKKYALIKYPVIDLYGSANLPDTPIPAATRDSIVCPRIHQGLFNECFEVLEISGNMIALSIPWAVYGYDTHGKPLCRYWAERKNIIFIDAIPNHHELLPTIPQYAHKKNVITLKRPFTGPNGTRYSVGTQFVCAQDQHEPDAFHVMYLDTHIKSLKYFFIPRSHAFKSKKLSTAESRQDFIKLLTEFVDEIDQQTPYNTIPYVWGGGSFTRAYSDDFIEDAGRFHRKESETIPLCGYDCSLLVLRFAQIAQVPYNFKTTAMLEKYGKKFTPADTLQEGDLIWLQGHVVVITDIKNTLVTQAVGYENFVGKLHTIKLDQLLKKIHTWDDLLHAYYKKHQVMRLDKFGNNFKESPVKIFKLF